LRTSMAQPVATARCSSGISVAFLQARTPLNNGHLGLLSRKRWLAVGAAGNSIHDACRTVSIAAGASAAAAAAVCHSRRRGCRTASLLTAMASTEKVATAPMEKEAEPDIPAASIMDEQPQTKKAKETKLQERSITGAEATPAEQLAQSRAAAKARARAEGFRTKNKKKEEYFDVTAQPGVTAPLGYWDPLGFCPLGDKLKFRKLRTSELKHGRVAMLASVGLVVQHYARFPDPAFDEIPSGIMAPLSPGVGGFGMGGFVFVCLVAEIIFNQDPRREVGDFGDPFKVGMDSRDMKDRELNNGRFAMLATTGIIAAELVTGKDSIEQLTFWQASAASAPLV